MKIAVLGGSFNPVHIGHAMLADVVLHECCFDKVLFVPTFIPPHKQMDSSVSAEQRLEMVRAFCRSSACDGNQKFFAEDCEILRGGTSYTVDTLSYLSEKYRNELAGEKLSFVMGQEVAAQFYKWKNPERISELADILIAARKPDSNSVETKNHRNKPSGNYSADYEDESYLEKFPYRHSFVENPVFPVSSTEIRARIAAGKSWRYLVPEAVFQYIISNNLYGSKND